MFSYQKEHKTKTNASFRQFVKDGLIGVIVVLVVVLLELLVLIIYEFSESTQGGTYIWEDILKMFVRLFYGPMTFGLLTAFIGSGIGGRFLETIPSKGGWIVSIFKLSVFSWLVVVGLSAIYAAYLAITQFIEDPDDVGFAISIFALLMSFFMVPSGIGAIIGLLIGSLAGVIFNPQRRLYRIVIGAISSAFVGAGFGIGIVGLLGFMSG